jgi:hypothetical protein
MLVKWIQQHFSKQPLSVRLRSAIVMSGYIREITDVRL